MCVSQQIKHVPHSEIPDYLSAEYFRLRDQEKAYLDEARHFRALAYNAETLEECLQLFDLAWKAEGQAFALAWRTLESMARKHSPSPSPSHQGQTVVWRGTRESTPGLSQADSGLTGNEIVSLPVGGIQVGQGEGIDSILQSDLAGEFEMLLAQEQQGFPVQDVYSLWTEDERNVTLTFWLPRDRSLEELEEDIDVFLGNLERKARGFEITDQDESYTNAVVCCTAVFAAK